ncbi:hydroxyisourate hydrolase [Stappia taiwanensis]|uniref:5-hydroxyisourate hydrolase n=1 Tax=Stappia taiwanensis TaxID=992267 RepID=A0A838XRS2_9HYPH|nr:hydroxyisourate hydrolase [Stappia taiwanensis]MBA4613145.1 hydroxyisourate hydrolase [Stappia taiwanensis]GGE80153.1 5-hydroxyisourate hydrolase [Stappia taiwanensis]
MGRLTTHVLDTALGRPADGLALTLWRARGQAGDGDFEQICSAVTNADGRVDAPLLEGDAFKPGIYELRFEAGAYLRARHGTAGALPDPLFLDVIPLRFGIAEPQAHYHVPLLLSPYGYSTYRGS